jgi:hypothetical protein
MFTRTLSILLVMTGCSDYTLKGQAPVAEPSHIPFAPGPTVDIPQSDDPEPEPEPLPGSTSGKVCGPDAIVDAEVFVLDGHGATIATTRTDTQGAFEVLGLDAGVYTVRVIKDDFEKEFEVLILEGEHTELAFEECWPSRGCFGHDIVDYHQGPTKDGGLVQEHRSMPERALGDPIGGDASGSFFSLGFGGHVTIAIDGAIYDEEGFDIRIVETTYNNNPCDNWPEKAAIWGSMDGEDFVKIGEICQDSEVDLADAGLPYVTHLRIVDVSDPSSSRFPGNADAYDLDGILCLNERTDHLAE